jgi:hypothetical protein
MLSESTRWLAFSESAGFLPFPGRAAAPVELAVLLAY